MALKNFKPTTPSQRQLVIVDRSGLWKGKPVKHLTEGLHSKGGRNNTGRVTARYQGGGHKRTYRMIDFKRRKLDVVGTVERLEYDPTRSALSRSSNMPMASWLTFWRRSVWPPATRSSPACRAST